MLGTTAVSCQCRGLIVRVCMFHVTVAIAWPSRFIADTCVPRGGIFLVRYIHISLLDTGSIADTCVTRDSIVLFSLHPNFAVRYCR